MIKIIAMVVAFLAFANIPAQAWTNAQWRTWSYCTKVWAKTYGSNAECRYFFTGR